MRGGPRKWRPPPGPLCPSQEQGSASVRRRDRATWQPAPGPWSSQPLARADAAPSPALAPRASTPRGAPPSPCHEAADGVESLMSPVRRRCETPTLAAATRIPRRGSPSAPGGVPRDRLRFSSEVPRSPRGWQPKKLMQSSLLLLTGSWPRARLVIGRDVIVSSG